MNRETATGCKHRSTRIGKNAPRRWGSHKTEVCKSCKAFRLLTHHMEIASDWRPASEYADATADQELP